MTQEELDALMNGDMGDIDESEEEFAEEETTKKEASDDETMKSLPLGYSDETAGQWPMPATDENKMVHQLDDVTKESEEKATEIFDIIEGISGELMEKEENVQRVIDTLAANVELFTTLSTKFPEVEAFKSSLAQNEEAINDANETVEVLQNSGDSIMNVMDIMQYQDIHRQKIERVINVMRALSKYMNTLFEGRIDDEKRVSSAKHLAGDTHNDLASTDDIEALLAQFGK
jgi:uncharacterized phage infection (PIP) family protein YhgE